MRKLLVASVVIAIAVVALLQSPREAAAIAQFQKEFAAKYAGEGTDEKFAALVKKAKCNVCHNGNMKITGKDKSSKKNKISCKRPCSSL